MPSSVASDSKLVRPEWRQWTTLNEWHWHVWKWENHRASAKINVEESHEYLREHLKKSKSKANTILKKKCEIGIFMFFFVEMFQIYKPRHGSKHMGNFWTTTKTSGCVSHPLFQKYASNCITFLSNLKGRHRSPRYLHLSHKNAGLRPKKCSN